MASIRVQVHGISSQDAANILAEMTTEQILHATADLDRKKTVSFVDTLVAGIDPFTGEILADDHLLKHPEVIQALVLLRKTMKKRQHKRVQDEPDN